MSIDTKEQRIKEMMIAKDWMEKAESVLRVGGYSEFYAPRLALIGGIRDLKADIINLQMGRAPYATIAA